MFILCRSNISSVIGCVFELYANQLQCILKRKLLKQQLKLLHAKRNNHLLIQSSCTIDTKELSKNLVNAVISKGRLFAVDCQLKIDHLSELQNVTGWNEQDTIEAVRKYPKLLRNNVSLSEVYKLLRLNGVSEKQIFRYPWLLAYSVHTIKGKLSLIKRIGINDETILLLGFSYKKLTNILNTLFSKAADKDRLCSRITYFCQHLNVEIGELVELTKEHSPILTIEFSKIQHIMELLEDAGVDAECIRKDLWIFRHNEDTMVERVRKTRSVGAPVKTWMLRCTEDVFQNSLDRWSEKVKVLGKDHTTIDYLSKRLNCSREYIQCLNEKDPRLLAVQPTKIKEVLDFLFQKGFSPEQICNATRILHYSLVTVQRRLKDFNDLDYHPTSLHVFCNTNKLHRKFLKKLKFIKKYRSKTEKQNSLTDADQLQSIDHHPPGMPIATTLL